MTLSTMQSEIQKDLATVIGILSEGNYKLRGLVYKYISCSGHVKSHQFRGVEIYYDRTQIEAVSKGADIKLDIFAYYNNKCYQIIF